MSSDRKAVTRTRPASPRDTQDLVRPEVIGELVAAATDDDTWRDMRASMITGGKSNLTFELTSDSGSLVLRRPPTGDIPRGAHDMRREVTVQRALFDSKVPVPRIVLLHEDTAAIGVPFYVMEKVEGYVVKEDVPKGYADRPEQRTAMSDVLVDTLVDLHAVDIDAVGLSGFGRPEGFLARQVRRWSDQSRVGRPRTSISELGAELADALPAHSDASVVHGDFRLDNCVYHPRDPGVVAAVLDWEMATLGDPLTDLGLLMFYWRGSADHESELVPTVTALPGFPSRADLVQRYAERSGRDVSGVGFYAALAYLKFAVIAQGIADRVAAGAMGGQDFGDIEGEIDWIVAAGHDALAAYR